MKRKWFQNIQETPAEHEAYGVKLSVACTKRKLCASTASKAKSLQDDMKH